MQKCIILAGMHRRLHFLSSSPFVFLYRCLIVYEPVLGTDPYVFVTPGSVSTRYGSGSGSFYHQAKIVRKTFIPPVFWLPFFLSPLLPLPTPQPPPPSLAVTTVDPFDPLIVPVQTCYRRNYSYLVTLTVCRRMFAFHLWGRGKYTVVLNRRTPSVETVGYL
jgi:hypothetical protein